MLIFCKLIFSFYIILIKILEGFFFEVKVVIIIFWGSNNWEEVCRVFLGVGNVIFFDIVFRFLDCLFGENLSR